MPVTETRTPLPFAELDAAGAATIARVGPTQAVIDALAALSDREVLDYTAHLEALDIDGATARLRRIAGGSLRAGKRDKALAAKCLELAGPMIASSILLGCPSGT